MPAFTTLDVTSRGQRGRPAKSRTRERVVLELGNRRGRVLGEVELVATADGNGVELIARNADGTARSIEFRVAPKKARRPRAERTPEPTPEVEADPDAS